MNYRAVYSAIVTLILVGVPGSASAWLFGTDKDDAGVIMREVTLIPEDFKIAAVHSGQLISLEVQPGNKVTVGQIVARLDDSTATRAQESAQARLKVAQQRLELAKIRTQQRKHELEVRHLALKRVQMQRKRLTVTQDEVDFAKARFQAAKSAQEEAEAEESLAQAELLEAESKLKITAIQLNGIIIRSSGEGEVTEIEVEPAEVVSTGQPIMRVQLPGRYKIALAVDQTLAKRLGLGTEVKVSVTDGTVLTANVDGMTQGRCVSGFAQADYWCQFALIKVQLSEGQVPPDRRVKVFIKDAESQAWPESLSASH